MSGLRGRSALWLLLTALPVLAAVLFIVLADDDDFGAIRIVLIVCAVLALVGLVAGWLSLFAPFFSRLNRVVDAAQRLSQGETVDRLEDRVPDEVGDVSRMIDRLALDRDNQRRAGDEIEQRFRHQTAHDPLTGVANRQHLSSEIERHLRADDGRSVGVLFVDLDDFRLVNELFGYAVGDEVLVATANRLRRLVGDDALVGRWSADEFLVVLLDTEPAMLHQLSSRVRALFDEPINTVAGPHPMACSVGTAMLDAGAGSVDELMQVADVTVQDEKTAHRRIRSIEPETARLVELALRENRLEVWYQPIVQLSSPTQTQMVGAEAFVRLRADDSSLRVPSEFLSEIMTSRYAREIDQRMASLMLSDMAQWQTRSMVAPDFFVSLNLSPASLRDAELASSLVELCENHGVSPKRIVLDVSEEAGELDQIIAADLRHAGFRLSIDDLGLKRSNFDRLFNIGAEFAKLHRRWLQDDVMLDALVNICQRKGLYIVAESVETMAELELLYSRGVRLCQGYVISRPISAAEFSGLLLAGRPQSTPAT